MILLFEKIISLFESRHITIETIVFIFGYYDLIIWLIFIHCKAYIINKSLHIIPKYILNNDIIWPSKIYDLSIRVKCLKSKVPSCSAEDYEEQIGKKNDFEVE